MLNLNAKEKSPREILFKYIKLLNVFEQDKVLLDLEIKVLVEFLLLPERFKYNRFSSLARKKILEALKENYDWSVSYSNLNTKIYSLRDKGFLWKDADNVLYVKPYLLKIAEEVLSKDSTILTVTFSVEANEETT